MMATYTDQVHCFQASIFTAVEMSISLENSELLCLACCPLNIMVPLSEKTNEKQNVNVIGCVHSEHLL